VQHLLLLLSEWCCDSSCSSGTSAARRIHTQRDRVTLSGANVRDTVVAASSVSSVVTV
jgi:hypothetical protein